VGPIANLSSPLQLFLNPSRIQIRTQFFCGSHFLPLLGPPNSFLPFSLSLLHCFSASLSLLSAISRPLHPRRQTEKYPTKQKQTEMQKIILSVLSDGQIHGHGFDSIGSTRPHQAHNDPEASKASEEAASGAGEEASKEIRVKLPPALARKLRRRSARSCLWRWRRIRRRARKRKRRRGRGTVPWLCTSTDERGKNRRRKRQKWGGYV
jgi:hypothetical protein